MPLKTERLPLAKQDLFNIWDYISPNSPKGATRVFEQIYSALSMLAEQPQAGRMRQELRPDLRSFPVAGYLIFYEHNTTTLTILRILHSARDITPEMLAD